MRVQDLQEFLGSFTEGSEAVKNGVIFVEINGKLHEIRRMEVLESTIIGDSSVMVVMKADKSHKLAVKSPTFNKT